MSKQPDLSHLDFVKLAHVKTCSSCGELFMSHGAWPIDTCTPCRVDNVDLHIQSVKSSMQRSVDKWAYKNLTVDQWIFALKHFNGRCAYCRKRHYAVVEHFIPICLGGGTSASNIVPSCLYCNAKKGNKHPAMVTKIPASDIDRVRSYLEQFSHVC